MKICCKCDNEQSLEKFHKFKASKDGYKSQCKECVKLDSKKYREKNQEIIIKNQDLLKEKTKQKNEELNLLIGEGNKICRNCGEILSYEKFHKLKSSKDGHKAQCKECISIYSKEYFFNNKEVMIIKGNINYYKNKESYKDTRRKYREDNKEEIAENKKVWSKSISGKESKKKYYQKNKEELKQKSLNNRDSKKEYYQQKGKEKRQTDKYKIYMSMYRDIHRNNNPHVYLWRSVLTATLKRIGKKKEGLTIELLGYSAIELKEHIESLFSEGMSWNNHGEWHLDHIKMVSSFDKDTPVNIINSLVNLRPLWATSRIINGVFHEGNLNRKHK